MSAIGSGSKSRVRQDFQEDRRIQLGFKDVQFLHQMSGGETGFNLADLTLPDTPGSFENPSPSITASINLTSSSPNLDLYNGQGKRMARGVDYEVVGTQINFVNITAAVDEVFFGTLRSVPRTGADFLDGEVKTADGFLEPGQTQFNVGFNYRLNKNPSNRQGSIKVYRQREIQYRDSSITEFSSTPDGDYIEVQAGNTKFGTVIEFDSPGVILPSGLPEFISVESRDIHIDKETGSLRAELESQQGAVLRIAEEVATLASKPVSDFLVPNPTQVQLQQFGDEVLELKQKTKVEANLTADTTSTVADTWIDVAGSTISLTPGLWAITANVSYLISHASPPSSVFGNIAIADDVNSIIEGSIALVGENATGNSFFGEYSRTVYVEVTADTDYKLRQRCSVAAATGTITVSGSTSQSGGLSDPDYQGQLVAVKLRGAQ